MTIILINVGYGLPVDAVGGIGVSVGVVAGTVVGEAVGELSVADDLPFIVKTKSAMA